MLDICLHRAVVGDQQVDRQLEHGPIGFKDQMPRRSKIARDRSEQRDIERTRRLNIECGGDVLLAVELRDRIPDLVDCDLQLAAGDRRAVAHRLVLVREVHEHVRPQHRHLGIGFTRGKPLHQFVLRDRPLRYDAVTRIFGQVDDCRLLLLLKPGDLLRQCGNLVLTG